MGIKKTDMERLLREIYDRHTEKLARQGKRLPTTEEITNKLIESVSRPLIVQAVEQTLMGIGE